MGLGIGIAISVTKGGHHGNGGVFAPPVLQVLSLSANTVAENSPEDTFVGFVQNKTPGSALTLSNDAGGRFKVVNVAGTWEIVTGPTATDYETATSHNITVVETLGGATGNPKATVLTVNVSDVAEGGGTPSLTISSPPTIAGDMVVGQVLFAVNGGYNVAPDSFTYQWYLDGAPIGGMTNDTLLIEDIYAGSTITLGEVAHKAGYSDSPLNMSA